MNWSYSCLSGYNFPIQWIRQLFSSPLLFLLVRLRCDVVEPLHVVARHHPKHHLKECTRNNSATNSDTPCKHCPNCWKSITRGAAPEVFLDRPFGTFLFVTSSETVYIWVKKAPRLASLYNNELVAVQAISQKKKKKERRRKENQHSNFVKFGQAPMSNYLQFLSWLLSRLTQKGNLQQKICIFGVYFWKDR